VPIWDVKDCCAMWYNELMMQPSNQEDIEYIAVDERQERIAALIKLAISDPEGMFRILDNRQGEGV